MNTDIKHEMDHQVDKEKIMDQNAIQTAQRNVLHSLKNRGQISKYQNQSVQNQNNTDQSISIKQYSENSKDKEIFADDKLKMERQPSLQEFNKNLNKQDPLSHPENYLQNQEPLIGDKISYNDFKQEHQIDYQDPGYQSPQLNQNVNRYNDDENQNVREAIPQQQARLYDYDPMAELSLEEAAFKENICHIQFLIIGIIYLGFSLYFYNPKSMYEEYDKKNGDTNKTSKTFDINNITLELLIQTLIPILVLRLVAYFKYRNKDLVDFRECYTYIKIFYHGAFGLWTLNQVFFNSQNISNAYKNEINLSLMNYQLLIILGLFSGAQVLFVCLIIIVLIPIFIYQCYQKYRERGAQARRFLEIKKALIQVPYEANNFKKPSECSICLEIFGEETENMKCKNVTPLPCNNLHLFHSDCIIKSLSYEEKCPLCREIVQIDKCKELKKNFFKNYPQSDQTKVDIEN